LDHKVNRALTERQGLMVRMERPERMEQMGHQVNQGRKGFKASQELKDNRGYLDRRVWSVWSLPIIKLVLRATRSEMAVPGCARD